MRPIHYLNDLADITACHKRPTRMLLHTSIADQVTCPACLNVMETRPF